MLTNTAFSHSNEECSPYFLVITHQTQARDDIDGLMQERCNSIANALEHIFLLQVIHIRSVICAPPPLLFPSMQWNQYDNALSYFCLILSLVNHWSMYWAYSITLYCTATYREYHIATVKFVMPNHSHHSQYLYWLLKSSWRCPVTQRCSLDMSLILCYSSMPSSDYLKMVGMDKYATLKM